ncbi:MAG TPA: BON domain-containing protein [Burkholderiales bacterium]|nr:BON domain-containing protein [Burkholderiales bacterium]
MKATFAYPRISTIALAAAAAFAFAPSLAAAAEPAQTSSDARFQQLDRNHDGFLSRGELKGYGKAFDEADANKDGKLDAGEFVKAQAIHDRMVAGNYVEDSVITAKVKAALMKALETSSLDVSVETLHGQVLLSGFVKSEAERSRAMKVAAAVNGVASVKDGMVVRED